MAGLMGTGRQMMTDAIRGFTDSAELEKQRELANKQMEAAIKAQQQQQKGMLGSIGSSIGGLAGSALFGGAFGGPIGAVFGGLLGFLFGDLF